MSAYDDSRENYSICIAYSEYRPNGTRLYKWHRIADYHPSAGQSLWPSLVEDDFTGIADKRAHPNHLYNPGATEGFDERATDFYVFEWRLSPQDPSKTLSRVIDPSSVFPRGCEPKEVVFPVGVNGQQDLRAAIKDGIPFEGRTSRIFYLVFDGKGNEFLAARCEARDFDFNDGRIRLRPKLSNFRVGLSVPVVRLYQSEIIEARHDDVRGREVYANMEELPEVSRIPLRPLSDYASEYVGWFARSEGKGLSRTDRQKITAVIEEAMGRPDALEEYMEAKAPEAEIQSFMTSVVAYARSEEDPVKSLIRDELLKDEEFASLCREEVLRESEEAIAAKRDELRSVSSQVEKKLEELSAAGDKAKLAWEELEVVEDDVAEKRKELDRLASQREELLGEYETDIALRLGLRAVASSRPEVQTPHGDIDITCGDEIEDIKTARTLAEALDRNMGSLGVRPLPHVHSEVRGQLAIGVVAALSATRFIAIPSPLAERIADALSVALFGRLATKVYVPTECRDISRLADLDALPRAVTVVENVIDAVNEGVLLALLHGNGVAPVILPFTSHASADLIAKEMWDRVFIPAAGALVALGTGNRETKLWKSGKASVPHLNDDDILGRMAELEGELGDSSMPVASLLLPAAVLEAAEDLGGLELGAVAQHLALASKPSDGVIEALSKATEGDYGLAQIARRLRRNA